jgi:hypothetical protein
VIFGEISVVVSFGVWVAFCGSPMEALVFEKLGKRLLVAFGGSGIGRGRVCPGVVGGSQGTALTALDYRCELRGTPDLFSNRYGIRGNIDGFII